MAISLWYDRTDTFVKVKELVARARMRVNCIYLEFSYALTNLHLTTSDVIFGK